MGPETRMGSATNGSFPTTVHAVDFGATGSVPSWRLRRLTARASGPPRNRQPATDDDVARLLHDRCRSCDADTWTFHMSADHPTWSRARTVTVHMGRQCARTCDSDSESDGPSARRGRATLALRQRA